MLEVLAYIALIYCIGAIITFIPLTFIHGGASDTFGIGIMIAAGLAFFWPLTVPVMLHVEWEERQSKRKKNGKDRN